MKISRDWLLEFVDFADLSVEDYSELITTRVAEVDATYTVGQPLKYAIVGKIIEITEHPNKSSLSVVKVSDGGKIYNVVSNIKDLKIDSLIAYVPPGGKIKKIDKTSSEEPIEENLIEVTEKEILGVVSQGAFVSEAELGLTGFHETAFYLDGKLKVGESLSSIFGGEDVIIEIDNKSLTHRPDLWSHLGFARELSAILKRPLKLNFDLLSDGQSKPSDLLEEIFKNSKKPKSPYVCSIGQGTQSSRVSGLCIEGLNNGPAPLWMRRRLFAVGVGIRNVLVDASNYVLFEVGQPNHAFDQRRITGTEITARLAKDGEIFIGLDNIERTLSSEDVVIADSSGPLDLAGVIGGKGFSVEEDTTKVLLVSSCFNPVRIRKTCKRNQIRTNSSNLYEKSLSPYQVPLATIRYIEILKRSGLNPIIPFAASDCFKDIPESIFIDYSPSYIRQRLGGKPESDQDIKEILERLSFEVQDSQVKVPYFRATKDISISDDLVEEVGRTIGYENIPESAPKILSQGSTRGVLRNAEREVRSLLCGMGYTEVYNYTFSSSELAESLGYDLSTAIEVQNPVDKNLKIVQVSLVPNLIDTALKNLKNTKNITGFEIGRSYHSLNSASTTRDLNPYDDFDSKVKERRLLGVFQTGPRQEKKFQSEPEISSGSVFFSVKESLSRLVTKTTGQNIELKRLEKRNDSNSLAENYQTFKGWMHSGRAASVYVGDICLGIIAEVKPSAMTFSGVNNISDRVVIAEIDLEALIATQKKPIKFQEYSRFPDSFFEISVVVDKTLQFDNVSNAISKCFKGKSYLKTIKPVSVFEGEPLGEGEKSLSLQFVFSKSDDTLSSEELSQIRDLVMQSVIDAGYSLRS